MSDLASPGKIGPRLLSNYLTITRFISGFSHPARMCVEIACVVQALSLETIDLRLWNSGLVHQNGIVESSKPSPAGAGG